MGQCFMMVRINLSLRMTLKATLASFVKRESFYIIQKTEKSDTMLLYWRALLIIQGMGRNRSNPSDTNSN